MFPVILKPDPDLNTRKLNICPFVVEMAQAQEKESVDYDEILDKVGHFGKFQKIILLLLSCCSAAGGLVVVVFPFTAYQQEYRWEGRASLNTLEDCLYLFSVVDAQLSCVRGTAPATDCLPGTQITSLIVRQDAGTP